MLIGRTPQKFIPVDERARREIISGYASGKWR
mgnify:CR=1 FL=1